MDKKAEAVARMKMLGIYPQTIRQFERKGLVSVSEPPVGAFFWADEDLRKKIAKFEQEHSALVYMVIHSYTSIGELLNYLYVSNYPDEWKSDRDDLGRGETIAYVENVSDPWCSELGYIGIERTGAAGLRRTW